MLTGSNQNGSHTGPDGLLKNCRGRLRVLLGVVPAILLALMMSGCATERPRPATSACSGDQYYFPVGTFPAAYPASDPQRRRWYSSYLARLHEPSLSCGNRPEETYRLTWLHTFAHPVVIRITRRDSQVEADAFQLSGSGGGDPGLVLYQTHKRLSMMEWELLQIKLRNSAFWSLPTSGNMYGVHGEQWILEGRRNNTYHIVDRWTPPDGPYRDLGGFIFDLVGWRRPDSSRY
jgi:hypothetical protein